MLEPFNQMSSYESTRPTDQRTPRHKSSPSVRRPLSKATAPEMADFPSSAMSSNTCAPNPEGFVDPIAQYPPGDLPSDEISRQSIRAAFLHSSEGNDLCLLITRRYGMRGLMPGNKRFAVRWITIMM